MVWHEYIRDICNVFYAGKYSLFLLLVQFYVKSILLIQAVPAL